MSKKNIRSHLGSHNLAAFQHPSNPKNPKKCSSPAPCSFGLPLHFSALKSLLIHRSCMGVYMGWAQLKQHTGPLQLASCSMLVAPVGKPSQSPAGPECSCMI